ncbi:MAG: XisI protein [Cyanothece sp. SIO2G6]|nr:XisI protein [Cyanothece sp. SIO2G6]
MDTLEHHRQIIRSVIDEYHQLNLNAPDPAIESVCVFDDIRDNYLLLLMGWQGSERIKSVMIHVRLHNNKFWIEEDWTEDGVATDLLQAGIEHNKIVLAFHPPQLRQHTEFAVT